MSGPARVTGPRRLFAVALAGTCLALAAAFTAPAVAALSTAATATGPAASAAPAAALAPAAAPASAAAPAPAATSTASGPAAPTGPTTAPTPPAAPAATETPSPNLTGIAKLTPTVSEAPLAYFDWFEYSGHDAVFDTPLPQGMYRNPILAGFYPDPSITRRGDVFYLVNSTFTYFPGIPIFESRDLVHWRQIGNVIERPNEFSFDGLNVSRGMFAPTIRFHDGVFYVVCTAVDSGGNFLTTAKSPVGPWSDPIFLPGLDGAIDPSLFFDDDGKVYLLNNGLPEGPPLYDGHRAIWIQELDVVTRKLIGPRKVILNGGVDLKKKPVWIEGPHMYLHDGWYILMCAEGGTSLQHSEVVLRSRSPWGPFEPYAGNPILTQRDLPADRPNPITNAGHADLVEAGDGSWWAVFLASRAYEGVHYNTGRETFMLPVTWHDGWPSILEAGKEIPYTLPAPKIGPAGRSVLTPTTGNFVLRDDFDPRVLQRQWTYVRVPKQPWADLNLRPGWLAIHALRTSLESLQNISFLARRQQHQSFDASTELEVPAKTGLSAGLVAFQNENAWYFLAVRHGELALEKRGGKQTDTIARIPLSEINRIKLKITANVRAYSFYFDADGAGWKALKENDDGSILSTDVAGGFVGAFVGPYARAE